MSGSASQQVRKGRIERASAAEPRRAYRWWMVSAALAATAFAAGVATRPRPSTPTDAPAARPSAAITANDTAAASAATPASRHPARRVDGGTPEAPPAALARALGVPAAEQFDREGRDDVWASAVEAAAAASYRQALAVIAPWADGVTVTCRTTLCKVALPVDEARVRATMNRVQVVSIAAGVSPFAEPTDDGRWSAGVYVRFDASEHALATLPAHWTDGVRARFPGGPAQLAAWLDDDERRAGDATTPATESPP